MCLCSKSTKFWHILSLIIDSSVTLNLWWKQTQTRYPSPGSCVWCFSVPLLFQQLSLIIFQKLLISITKDERFPNEARCSIYSPHSWGLSGKLYALFLWWFFIFFSCYNDLFSNIDFGHGSSFMNVLFPFDAFNTAHFLCIIIFFFPYEGDNENSLSHVFDCRGVFRKIAARREGTFGCESLHAVERDFVPSRRLRLRYLLSPPPPPYRSKQTAMRSMAPPPQIA